MAWGRDPKVVFALGGGGARGIAHAGVLRTWIQKGLPLHGIMGTSMGGLVAVLFGFFSNPDEAVRRLLTYAAHNPLDQDSMRALRDSETPAEGVGESLRRFLRMGAFALARTVRQGVIDLEAYKKVLEGIVPPGDFSDLSIPVGVLAGDLQEGKGILFREGPLLHAVSASTAIPGVFPPIDGRFVDGGLAELIPVHAAWSFKPDIVVAVDVRPPWTPLSKDSNGYKVALTGYDLLFRESAGQSLSMAHMVLRPEMGKAHWSEFSKSPHFLRSGEKAVEQNLPAIQAMLRKARWKTIPVLGPQSDPGPPPLAETTGSGKR